MSAEQVDALRERIERLSPEQRSRFEQEIANRGISLSSSVDLVAAVDTQNTVRRATYAQERMWFLDQLVPGNSAYNLPIVFELQGPVNEKLLDRSLVEVVRRHESLRTTFDRVDGILLQVVHGTPEAILSVHNVGSREKALDSVQQEVSKGFDLHKGPLTRTSLYRFAPDSQVLCVNVHHSVIDGVSVGIFLHELSLIYNAFCSGGSFELSPLSLQFSDVGTIQRRELDESAAEDDLEWWKAYLNGAPRTLDLPTDRPRPVVQQFEGASHQLRIPCALFERLVALGQSEGVTLYMILLSAFSATCHYFARQNDLLLGTPVAARERIEYEPMIGCFANTLLLRSRLDSDVTFRDWLQRTKESVLASSTHQSVPFERIVDELQVERDLTRQPLFQVLFGLQNETVGNLRLSKLSSWPLDFEAHGAKFDLEVNLARGDAEVNGVVLYNSEIFDEATVQRLFDHWIHMLEESVRDPNAKVAEVSTARAPVPAILRGPVNDSEYEPWYLQFERQAIAHPDVVAVIDSDSKITYAELNARAASLSIALLGLDISVDSLVGVALPRSVDMVIALLAVSKTGAAYLPLDLTYPPQRVMFMLQDARPNVVITTADWEHLFRDCENVLVLGDMPPVVPRSIQAAPPSALAYVIYTSGSTGRPKGVGVPHGSLSNFLGSMCRSLEIDHSDVVLASTTLSFDIAALELLAPLTVGGSVVIVESSGVLDPEQVWKTVRDRGVTVMQATPSAWSVLVKSRLVPQRDQHPRILSGGEMLSRALAVELLDNARSVFNLFGPTETTVWSSFAQLSEDELPSSISVGLPIDNTDIYVLDETLRPVSAGMVGAVFIGGAGVSRGYIGAPGQTAERFLPDPFRGSGERMYRTGDNGRMRSNGSLEIVGRDDLQIKLRGHRIELGEIEAVAVSMKAVDEAVALIREYDDHDKRLMLYVRGENLNVASLREGLRSQLPSYMLPSDILVLDAFPRTLNGKVDRSALPLVKASADKHASASPDGEVSRVLHAMWKELLKVDRIGMDDAFFDLGGHSLLMATLRERLSEQFPHFHISMMEMFQLPTIRLLANAIEGKSEMPSRLTGGLDDDRAARRRQAMSRRRPSNLKMNEEKS